MSRIVLRPPALSRWAVFLTATFLPVLCYAVEYIEGDGWTLHEGTIFLLPYYLGRYHDFIN